MHIARMNFDNTRMTLCAAFRVFFSHSLFWSILPLWKTVEREAGDEEREAAQLKAGELSERGIGGFYRN